MRIFRKIQYFFDFCTIKAHIRNCLVKSYPLVPKLYIISQFNFWAIFWAKGGPLRQKNKTKNILSSIIKKWVPIDSSRRDNSEYVLFILQKLKKY